MTQNSVTGSRIKSIYVSKHRRGFLDSVELYAEETGTKFTHIVVDALMFYFFSGHCLTPKEIDLFNQVCDAAAKAQGNKEILHTIFKEIRSQQITRDPKPGVDDGINKG